MGFTGFMIERIRDELDLMLLFQLRPEKDVPFL